MTGPDERRMAETGDETLRRRLLLGGAGLWGLYLGLSAVLTLVSDPLSGGLWQPTFPIGPEGRMVLEGLAPELLMPRPGLLSKLTALLGLGVMASFPGLPLALTLPSERPLDLPWLSLRTVGFSLAAFCLNLCLLKGLMGIGLPLFPSPLAFVLMGGLEAGLAYAVLRRRSVPLVLERPTGAQLGWWGLVLLFGAGLTGHHLPYVWRELSAYWYHPEAFAQPEDGDTGRTLEVQGISLTRGGDWQQVPAERPLFSLDGVVEPQVIEIKALSSTSVVLQYLWMGPVGSRLTVDCEDIQQRILIESAPEGLEGEGPTLRYLDQGLGLIRVNVPVRESRTCRLVPENLVDRQTGTLLDLTEWPVWELVEAAASQGWILTHYYQILNLAENIQWGRELLSTRWVTLNQPPLWSYVYAAVMVFVGPGLWALNLFFFGLVLGLVGLSGALSRVETGVREPVDYLCGLPLLGIGAMHARIIIASGSTNFPDNLYPLGVLAGIYALWTAQPRGFALSALTTTLIRYPGSAFLALTPALTAWINPGRRRLALQGLLWSGGLVAGLGLLFGLAGLLSGELSNWLGILYFETLPEHFHDQYALAELLPRPLEFYGLLLLYSGYTPVLVVLGQVLGRSRLARQLLLTTLAYTGLLCFIDHFPSHYFVTPMYLLGTAFSATLLGLSGWKRWGLLVIGMVGLLYALQAPL